MKPASPYSNPREQPAAAPQGRLRRKRNSNTELVKVGELYVERSGSRSIVGNIYKGVVDNVLPGMEAAFVDIGLERNGFLHVDEIVLPDGQKVPRRGHGKGRRIDELIKPKQEVLVQVVKDPLKTKGARLSMQLSIAGRYLVYMPQGGGVGASRRLSEKERERQRKLLQKLHKGDGGVIVRTAAQGALKGDFERDLAYLHKLHEVVDKRGGEVKAPGLVFQEADLSIRVLRDVLTKEFDGAVIDDPKQHQRVTSFFQRTAPELVDLVELYEGYKPLFEREQVEEAYPLGALAPGGAAIGRLPDDRLRRGADRDRHQHGQLHRPRPGTARGHDHQGQRRGGRGGRAPAAAARHRRDHRHRLHRHGAGVEPRPGAEDAAQGAERGQDQDLRGRGLAARAWWR